MLYKERDPGLKSPGSWKLHRNNAPTHLAHIVEQFLAKHDIPIVS